MGSSIVIKKPTKADLFWSRHHRITKPDTSRSKDAWRHECSLKAAPGMFSRASGCLWSNCFSIIRTVSLKVLQWSENTISGFLRRSYVGCRDSQFIQDSGDFFYAVHEITGNIFGAPMTAPTTSCLATRFLLFFVDAPQLYWWPEFAFFGSEKESALWCLIE